MARPLCSQCGFLQMQCVCQWVPSLTSSLQVLILQHPKESTHAKNTVKLLTLALPTIQVAVIETQAQLLLALTDKPKSHWRLVFPTQTSVAIETVDMTQSQTIDGIILIDATWRKALAMYLTYPVLSEYLALHFASPPRGNYYIRKSPSEHTLSTLEACAYSVESLTGQTMAPLREFFQQAQQWLWRHRP